MTPKPESETPPNPMNMTAAELRREFNSALTMVYRQAEELAALRARLAAVEAERDNC